MLRNVFVMEKLMTFNSDNTEDDPRIQWGKPESRTAYGHSQLRHGQRIPLQSLKDRARSSNKPQGQFYNDATIVEAERRVTKTFGVHIAHWLMSRCCERKPELVRGQPPAPFGRGISSTSWGFQDGMCFDNPIGRVVHPDGAVTENANKVLVVRKRDGTVRTSYPIIEETEYCTVK